MHFVLQLRLLALQLLQPLTRLLDEFVDRRFNLVDEVCFVGLHQAFVDEQDVLRLVVKSTHASCSDQRVPVRSSAPWSSVGSREFRSEGVPQLHMPTRMRASSMRNGEKADNTPPDSSPPKP